MVLHCAQYRKNFGREAHLAGLNVEATRNFTFNSSLEDIIDTCVDVYVWTARANDRGELNNYTHVDGGPFTADNQTWSIKVHAPPTLVVAGYDAPAETAVPSIRHVSVVAHAASTLSLDIHAFDCNRDDISIFTLEDPGLPNGAELSAQRLERGRTEVDAVKTLTWSPTIEQVGHVYR